MATLLGAQLSTFDLETVVPTTSGNPKGHMTGLRVTYASASTFTVESGEARDALDAYDLTLAAQVTVNLASTGALGINEATLTATATTHATATFEPSTSIWSETAMTATVRSLTGTNLSGAGTTITGTGTKFLSECAVGDLIRSVSKGGARITAIASDTSLTIAAAFPGGNPNGDAGTNTLYENVIVRIAAETPQRVNTISHAGTSVVVPSSWTSNTSGVTIKLGGEIVSAWYFPHVVYGGSGTSVTASAQRTTPYPITGYDTAFRRVGSNYNNSSGNLVKTNRVNAGNLSIVFFDDCITDGRVIAGGTATTRTQINCSGAIPPTAFSAQFLAYQVYSATARTVTIYATGAAELTIQVTGTTSTVSASAPVQILGQAVDYIEGGAGSSLFLDVLSYMEVL